MTKLVTIPETMPCKKNNEGGLEANLKGWKIEAG